nr:trypsin-3-like [Lepeophtheirus salmonis]
MLNDIPFCPSFSELNCSCGLMNGELYPDKTYPNQFPWQVGFLQTINQRIMCGGALLSDLFVITSASCMKTPLLQSDSEREYYFKIVLGEHNVGDKGKTQWFWGRKIIVYPDYNNLTGENDLAILVLSQNATMNEMVSNLCLPERFREPFMPLPQSGITAGWATLKHKPNEVLTLHHEELEISQDCLSGSERMNHSTKICGRSSYKDCRGDLGGYYYFSYVCMFKGMTLSFSGPLFGKIEDEDHYTLFGIASQVDDNCEYITFSSITQDFLKWSRMVLLGTSLCPREEDDQ